MPKCAFLRKIADRRFLKHGYVCRKLFTSHVKCSVKSVRQKATQSWLNVAVKRVDVMTLLSCNASDANS